LRLEESREWLRRRLRRRLSQKCHSSRSNRNRSRRSSSLKRRIRRAKWRPKPPRVKGRRVIKRARRGKKRRSILMLESRASKQLI